MSALDAAEELLSILPGIRFDKHIINKPTDRESFLERINAMISDPNYHDSKWLNAFEIEDDLYIACNLHELCS